MPVHRTNIGETTISYHRSAASFRSGIGLTAVKEIRNFDEPIVLSIIPRSLCRSEQGAEATVEAQLGDVRSASLSWIISFMTYWRPTEARRLLLHLREVPSGSTVATAYLGIRIEPRGEKLRQLVYRRIKQLVMNDYKTDPIGSLEPKLRAYQLAIEFETLLESRADWSVDFLRKCVIAIAGGTDGDALRRSLEELCPRLILTFEQWDGRP